VQGTYGRSPSRRQRRRMRQSHRRRRHPLLRLLRTLIVLVILVVIVEGGLNPWMFHIGGKFTPTGAWSGFGTIRASNGGRYVLSVSFHGGALGGDETGCDQFGCDNLRGTARLCTANGSTYTFPMTGQVHTWLSTSGALTQLSLTGGSPRSLPSGWVVAWRGNWHGDNLALASPDNSFTEVFTPRGAIRTVTSTADAGTAHVTLAPGTAADLSRACSSL
jgi:hypothetical protein